MAAPPPYSGAASPRPRFDRAAAVRRLARDIRIGVRIVELRRLAQLERSLSNPPPAQQPSRNLTDAEAACWRAQTIDEAKAAARDIVRQEIAALRNYYETDAEGNEGLLAALLASVFDLTLDQINTKFAQLPPGPPGPMGKLPPVKIYEDVVHYADDVVVHHGSLWQARVDTGKAPPHSDWICLAAAGRDGVDGASPRVRATFDADIVYKKLDIVALNHGAFVARQDDPGPCPGDGWQLICSRGRTGERGAQGPRGEKG